MPKSNVLSVLRLILLCVVLASSVTAQDSRQQAQSVDVTAKMHFLSYFPEGYDKDTDKKWPLLIFLHGAGERGTDLNLVKKWGPPKMIAQGKDLPLIVVSPQCPENSYWNLKHLDQLIESVIKNNRVDEKRIYLTGLSMGGFGTWALTALHPEKFAAIAPICGVGDPETAELLLDVPIWAFHGEDDKVVPVSGTIDIVEAIKAKGGTKAKMTVYEGVGHNSWSTTYANPELIEWFLKHKKN